MRLCRHWGQTLEWWGALQPHRQALYMAEWNLDSADEEQRQAAQAAKPRAR